jgi:hypothetical protein
MTFPPGTVLAWVDQKLVNITFYEFFDVRFCKYFKEIMVNDTQYKMIVITNTS